MHKNIIRMENKVYSLRENIRKNLELEIENSRVRIENEERKAESKKKFLDRIREKLFLTYLLEDYQLGFRGKPRDDFVYQKLIALWEERQKERFTVLNELCKKGEFATYSLRESEYLCADKLLQGLIESIESRKMTETTYQRFSSLSPTQITKKLSRLATEIAILYHDARIFFDNPQKRIKSGFISIEALDDYVKREEIKIKERLE